MSTLETENAMDGAQHGEIGCAAGGRPPGEARHIACWQRTALARESDGDSATDREREAGSRIGSRERRESALPFDLIEYTSKRVSSSTSPG